MFQPTHFEMLSRRGEGPAALGFKLTGRAKEGAGLCRVWLRRVYAWDRYLDPRIPSSAWDVRLFRKVDAAFVQEDAFSFELLDGLLETHSFPQAPEGLASIQPCGDPVHDRVLAWAKRACGVSGTALTQAVSQEESDDWSLETTP